MNKPAGHRDGAHEDLRGLSAAEVRQRTAEGKINVQAEKASRSLSAIVRANTLTLFNAILGGLLVLILAVGEVRDALFGLVLISNMAIGILQEMRAKITLDRLSLLTAPRTRVMREGQPAEIAIEEVVLDDVIELSRGDQVVADGVVLDATGLEVDESLLTGEADPQFKSAGDELLSGSFSVAGSGFYRATAVGPDSFAHRLTGQAKHFTLVHSELNSGINRILRAITWIMIPTGALLFWRELSGEGLTGSVAAAVAAMVGMIPEGLVLLTSVAFALAVIVLGRRKVLVQELPAVEGLARADIVCFDKTGTLTEAGIVLDRVEMLGQWEAGQSGKAPSDGARPDAKADSAVSTGLAALASDTSSRNPTMDAIATAFPEPAASATARVPFSSERKWSAVTVEGSSESRHRTWLLGAPDIILRDMSTRQAAGQDSKGLSGISETVKRHSADGKRVLLLGSSETRVEEAAIPEDLQPVALLLLEEKMRPDAAEVLRYLKEEGMELKVISGDNPLTVAAVARRAGLKIAGEPVDGPSLPEDPQELAALLETRNVFGRVTAQQKQTMVRSMQKSGHVVVMAGDGVNDVLALKEAEIGIAMGTGAAAGTKAVAQFVLLEARFATIPEIVAEGRRVLADVERVAYLFVTKTCYATLLAISVGILGWPFPFLPRHLTLVGAITIGTPAFFLALAPNRTPYVPGFVGRVLRFTIPSGFILAAVTLSSYALSRATDTSIEESRTLATLVLTIMGLWVLVLLARPLTLLRMALIFTMIAGLVLVIVTPTIHQFFEFQFPPAQLLAGSLGIAATAMALLTLLMHVAGWEPRGGRRWIKKKN